MIRPVTTLGEYRATRAPTLFVLVEILLLLAIPVLGYVGAQSLLDTRAGNIVEQLTPSEPGWIAMVDPSPVTGVVEVLNGKVTGATIIAQQRQSQPGGTVILVWPTMEIDGVKVGDMAPEDVIPALSLELGLQIPMVEILDEARWITVLGNEVRSVDNPDPLFGDNGESLLAVGPASIGAAMAATFTGQTAVSGNLDAAIVRRTIWWNTLLDDPPSGEDDLAALIRAVGGADHTVVDLPTQIGPASEGTSSKRTADPVLAEQAIVDAVPFPAGSEPGDRLQIRILDRAGDLDLEFIARSVARLGYEVVQIGNAWAFDGGPSELIVPAGVTDARINLLAELFGAATVYQTEYADQADSADESASQISEQSDTITLIVGSSAAEMSTP